MPETGRFASSRPNLSSGYIGFGRQTAHASKAAMDFGRTASYGEEKELPRGLDLFCGAGGCSEGYWRRGFRMYGIDYDAGMLKAYRHPQAHMDALAALKLLLEGRKIKFVRYEGKNSKRKAVSEEWLGLGDFAFIHASPPCQVFSDLAKRNPQMYYPDLLTPIRPLLRATGLPYVIENVDSAPMEDPTLLCGTMFPGLRVLRHRLFEANFPIPQRPHGKHPLVFTYDKRKPHFGKLDQDTAFVQVTGGGNCTIRNAREAMGIDWMNKRQINEAIPPVYTEYIARFVPGCPNVVQYRFETQPFIQADEFMRHYRAEFATTFRSPKAFAQITITEVV